MNSREPASGGRCGLLAVYEALTSAVYAFMWLGHTLLPPLRKRLAPRLAMDVVAAAGKPLIHFHASSVGEISSIAPVMREVAKKVPDHALLITTMTRTSLKRAEEVMPGARAMLIPYDLPPAMGRFLRACRPVAVIVAETELWPNLLRGARRQGASLVLVNGRISTRSIGRYRSVRSLVGCVLAGFDLLLMRSEEDAARIRSLGADPDRISVMGNTKYDALPGPVPAERRAALRRSLGIAGSRPVVTLGSAREGESEILLRALAGFDAAGAPAVVLVPRHLDRVGALEDMCRSMGYGVRLSAGGGRGRPPGNGPDLPGRQEEGAAGRTVIIVNEMGKLLEYFAISDIGIVGGTFRPYGGHNPLEPASQGAAVVLGPYRDNISDDVEYLLARDAAVITDEDGLGDVIGRLLSDREGLADMAARAASAVQAGKGAARRCVDAMKAAGVLP